MNTFSFFNLLLPSPVQGLLWTILIALLCFLGVHVTALAKLGWRYQSQRKKAEETSPPPKDEKRTPAEKPQAPVYYIVEKKKRLPKSLRE